jgi:SAM-dependent methyltransferase
MAMNAVWASVAPGWEQHADFIDERALPLTYRMLEVTAPQRDERVLELACGPGSVALAAAPMAWEVVASDFAPEMTAIAAQRAADRGLDNVTARTLDMQDIDEPDASFDVVLCREGLMLVPDPERAVSEIQRVLRPDGRWAVSVWGPRERNPWLGVVLDAVSEQVGMQIPPPGVPGPFSLDSVQALSAVLGGAEVEEVPVPLHADSVEEWSSRVGDLAGPLAAMLHAMDPETAAELQRRFEQAAQPYLTDAGLTFPGVALLASGRR